MSETGLTDEQLHTVIAILRQELDPFLIYLFGSAARKQLRTDSDIDLAFLSVQTRDGYEVFVVAQQIAALLGREVDLIDLKKASTVLQAQIITKGNDIYAADRNQLRTFEMRTLKEYALLNEERQIVLDNFGVRREPDAK